MDIKKLKTSQLLDQLEDQEDDALFSELLDAVYGRIPFADTWEKLEEIEKRNKELEEEIQKLRNSMRGHTHLITGKSVIEI